jgi:methyltransferase (TIGR00027 family)
MEKRDPRKMALQIAGLRANETYLPENERMFQDPYAEYFFPDEIREKFKDTAWVKAEQAKHEALLPGVNGAIAARIKFIDDCVLDCLKRHFKQLVIIGAGYDTRPYRIKGVKENMRVFEVDHPMTQEIKTNTISAIFNTLPDHVVFVPMIFGQDRLDHKLFQAGYRPDLKTLFIIEGLLMYIPLQAVESLLAFIARASGAESAFVADFFSTSVVDGTSPLKEAQTLRQFVQNEGAPLQFGIPEKTAETFFKKYGFAIAMHMNAKVCKEKYFTGLSRERSVSPMFNFVLAVVQS